MKKYNIRGWNDDHIIYQDENGSWVDADIAQELYSALEETVEILEGIFEDPEVMNVFDCHLKYQDIVKLKSVLAKADE